MTTVIKIGDKVTWRQYPAHSRSERIDAAMMALRIRGCKVLALLDIDGKPGAIVDCGGIFGKARVYLEDVELDEKPDKTTILSGG